MEENQVRANNYNKVVRYKECLKNHAAANGGNATDGCGEFMPNGEQGSIEALDCSACNFHRTALFIVTTPRLGGNSSWHRRGTMISSRVEPPQPMIMSYKGGLISSARPSGEVRKRFRTKFSQEQKEKMWMENSKAERVCRAAILPRDWNAQ